MKFDGGKKVLKIDQGRGGMDIGTMSVVGKKRGMVNSRLNGSQGHRNELNINALSTKHGSATRIGQACLPKWTSAFGGKLGGGGCLLRTERNGPSKKEHAGRNSVAVGKPKCRMKRVKKDQSNRGHGIGGGRELGQEVIEWRRGITESFILVYSRKNNTVQSAKRR